jgi:hypothetical protein
MAAKAAIAAITARPNFNSFVVVSLPSSAQVFDFALVYFLAANVLKYCGAK